MGQKRSTGASSHYTFNNLTVFHSSLTTQAMAGLYPPAMSSTHSAAAPAGGNTMTRIARTCALLLLTCAQAGLAAGQTVPTSFTDLKFVVLPGDRVMVVDRSGIETAGRISELDASMLTLSTNAGQI